MNKLLKLYNESNEFKRQSIELRFCRLVEVFTQKEKERIPSVVRSYLTNRNDTSYEIMYGFICRYLKKDFYCTTNSAVLESIENMVFEGESENIEYK